MRRYGHPWRGGEDEREWEREREESEKCKGVCKGERMLRK